MSQLEPTKYSERLGVIAPDQLHVVADRFGLGEIVRAYPATGGLFGQNVMLETTEGRFVFRGNPHGHVQLMKERRVAAFLHERSSLPAPWPYRICDDAALFGWTYAVMPMLEGESGHDLWGVAAADARVQLAAACGEALAMLHEATSSTFGPYEVQLDDFVVMEDFETWWLARLDHWRNLCRAVNALSAEAERFIDAVLERNLSALREPFVPVLVHHDFDPGNVNFISTGPSYEPSGVFDLFEAYLGDGEEDLVRMLWAVQTDREREAFIEAYVERKPLRDGAAERLELYALADWLVIWEYGKRNGTMFKDTAFADSFRPILANARNAATMARRHTG